jgi:hypothetical protein
MKATGQQIAHRTIVAIPASGSTDVPIIQRLSYGAGSVLSARWRRHSRKPFKGKPDHVCTQLERVNRSVQF